MTEKEKQELYENICNDISCGTYILAPQYVDKLLAKLEEENAELKEQIKTFQQIKREYTDYTINVEEERTFVKEQLTKAKKIIKKLYSHVFQGMGFMELNDFNAQKAEAEQFLKENE